MERDKWEIEEMRERCEGEARDGEERNPMKVVRLIMILETKMQKDSERQMEEKDRDNNTERKVKGHLGTLFRAGGSRTENADEMWRRTKTQWRSMKAYQVHTETLRV